MADPHDRSPRNLPGSYYVDHTCTDCDLCRFTAPAVFTRDDLHALSYVFHQPATPTELAAAEEARLSCPTDSIGREEVSADHPASR